MVNSDAMINPSIVKLLDKVEDRYSLIIATSKRARQIIAGNDALINIKSNKPLTIAINEINKEAVFVVERKEGIK